VKIQRRYRLDVGCAVHLGQIGERDHVILRFILPYGRQRRVLQALRRKGKPTAITLFIGGSPAIYMKYVEMVSEDWRVQFSKLHADETVEILLACDEARVYDVPLPSYGELPVADWPVAAEMISHSAGKE